MTDVEIEDVLSAARTIAVVGASANPARPSHGVMHFLMERGHTVHPVNPGHAGGLILGRTVYARLADVPGPIDMVDVFRASDAVPAVVEETLALDPLPRVLWLQLGVGHSEAEARAAAAGLTVVADRCPKIEVARLALPPLAPER